MGGEAHGSLGAVRARAHEARRRARPVVRRAVRWTMRAGLDLRDAVTGRRDPLVPPRRKGLPTQLVPPGERFVAVGLLEAGGLRPSEHVLDTAAGRGA
jgi:hypothetical protein